MLLFLSGLGRVLSAQCTLTCNQGLQVSLDPAGQALITTQLIAPNAPSSCPGALDLTLYNHLGQQIPNPLGCDDIGQTITARVRHLASGNFCTGDLEVMDAIGPTVSCPDQFVFCNQSFDPADVAMPVASDNCTPSGGLSFNHFDSETDLGCGVFQNGVPVLKRIDRAWTVTDDSGNSTGCTQKIWIKHIRPTDIVYPLNRDNISAPALTCGEDPEDLSLTGEPTVTGLPVGSSIECEIAVTSSDQIINHCPPASYTVLRTWTTIDFCTGTLSSRVQIIKVEDKIAPVLTPPADLTIGTDGFSCSGSVTLPPATATDNCSAVSILPTWQYGSGYGPFGSVPVGTHTVTYTATDACSNTSSATMRVTVEDTSPPQAICSASLQLSLSASGGAFLNAGTIGVNSSDNCGPVFLMASRDAQNYASQLFFNCADIGAPITVTLRVTDAVGLENFCETEVSVRDFLKPNIQCPANVTLTCLQDHTNLSLTAQATATDNCTLQSIIYQDNVTLNACNTGTVARAWKAIDAAGNIKTCAQNITMNAVNTTAVVFPPYFLVNGCGLPNATHPDATGWPVTGGQACSALSINYTDHVFSGAPPFCSRILRDWKVVDHCIYDPNGGTAGVWESTQIIDIVDHTPPVLEPPADITVNADQQGCMANVSIPDAFGADCSLQVEITNNSPFANAWGPNASGTYPPGQHLVTFIATDGCGNSTIQTMKITVADQTPPAAVCLSGVAINISANGTAILPAIALDGGSWDACSPQNSLHYAVSPDTFNCQDIGLQLVTLTVRDTAGNTAGCSALVHVKDNAHVCGGGGLGFVVDGTIRTPTGLAVRNIPVRLAGNGFDETANCDTLGFFDFQDVPQGGALTLQPANNANWLNGVTTFDLVLISKHILGITPLSSPLKMIAADANRSNSITTFDIVQLRKVLLGILDTVPGNTSWRFIDSTFAFPDTLNPFSSPLPESILFNNLSANQLGENFTAIKVGDVNNSTDPDHARSPQDTLWLNLGDKAWNSGERFAVPVEVPEWRLLEGFQFELEFDSNLVQVESIDFPNSGVLDSRNVSLREGKRLSVSWDNTLAAGAPDSQLFTLNVLGVAASEVFSAVKICTTRLSPEAYTLENEDFETIVLGVKRKLQSLNQNSLQLYPNPSSGAVQVQNPLGEAAERLRIFDEMGQVVREQQGVFSADIIVSRNGLLPGIYLVELTGQGQQRTGKLILL